MDVVVRNGLLVTMDRERRVLKNFSLRIEDGRISEIEREVSKGADFVIEAKRKIVMPGFVNTHTHLPMTLLRGIADELPLTKWLREEIWPVERKLEDKHVYAGALLGCLEMIKSGTTCFNDMYFFLDVIARAVEESGIRAVLSYAMTDMGDKRKREFMLGEGEKSVRRHAAGDMIRAFVAPHAPYTCSEELLVRAKELADRYSTGLHIHVAETKEEVENSRKEKGMRPFEYLNKIGVLDSNVIAAHSVWTSGREIKLIAKKGVKIAHNPVCNMKLASGVADVPGFLSNGITVSLGTDGAASNNSLDMFGDIKVCALLHKLNKKDASVIPAEKVLEFATIGGARALGMEKETGSIEAGKKADLILVDLEKPNMTPLTNPVSHLVYSATGCDVDTVLVNGKIIMEKRQLRTLDENGVLNFAGEQVLDLLEKSGRGEKLF